MEIDMSVLEEVKVTSYSIGGAGGDIVPIACEANSDGSVRTIPDPNRDGFLNNGFGAGGGFADNVLEVPANEFYSQSCLGAGNP